MPVCNCSVYFTMFIHNFMFYQICGYGNAVHNCMYSSDCQRNLLTPSRHGRMVWGIPMARPRNDANPDAPERGRGRISLPLTPDGTGFDFDQMRESTRERLCQLMEDNAADIYRAAGRPVPGTETDGAEMDPFGGITLENVHTGLDILSQANALAVRMVAPRFMRHPFKRDPKTGKPLPLVIDPDILQRCFTLTETQHAELDPRAHRVAQKLSGRMPDWLKRNLDVYMLLAMYVKYTGENALTAMQTQVKRDVELVQQAATRRPVTRPVDTDRPPATENTQPVAETVDTYPPPAPANGGMAAEL